VNWLQIKTYSALTTVSLLYGINFSVLKIAVPEYVGPYGFIIYRVVVASIVFWICHLLISTDKINWKEDGWRMAACGLTGVSVNMLLFYKGISLTSAVNGSIMMTLTPILVLIWSSLILKERVTHRKVLGIALGLVGALIIVVRSGPSAGDSLGDFFVFLNATSFSLYFVLVKPLMAKYKPLTVLTWTFTFGLVFALPVGWEQAVSVDFAALPMKVWYSIAYAIIGVTIIVYFLNNWTLTHVAPSVAGSFIYLQPVFATITAILFFGEVFLLKHLLAMALVFMGVALVTLSPNHSFTMFRSTKK
jgi:drug/metabolite transporter (DMT)-like permease